MGDHVLLGETPQATLCHLCGVSTTMTRAHVPPQCAGNRSPVTRSRVVIRDRTLRPGRPSEGGIWVRTLCAGCNGLASRYDGAYGEFSEKMRHHLPRALDRTSIATATPVVKVAPGRVARSVLLGAVAVAPVIRQMHPTLTRDLLAEKAQIRLPEGLELRVARTTGPFCRVASSYHMHRWNEHVGTYMEHLILAEIHFTPLSWVLTHERSSTERLVDYARWGDATDWVRYDPAVERLLPSVLRTLPVVRHPRTWPVTDWLELLGPPTLLLEGRQPGA